MLSEQVGVVLTVTRVLDRLTIPYVLGGSFASAAHGLMRATLDADVVADLRIAHAAPLARALGDAFYADVEAMQDAIRHRSSFNLIHLDTAFKIDVFVARPRPFDQAQLARRQAYELGSSAEDRVYVLSPEDVVLAKLEWYRKGGEVSERQWHDVLGVLRVQGARLDRDYMEDMATTLGVADLLARALGAAA
jgi:hypothetical protein